MSEFEFAAIAIGGVALSQLIPRWIEFLKTAVGLAGTRNIWIVAGCMGGVFSALAGAIMEGLIPAAWMPFIKVGMYALMGVVAAAGAVGEFELKKRFAAQS